MQGALGEATPASMGRDLAMARIETGINPSSIDALISTYQMLPICSGNKPQHKYGDGHLLDFLQNCLHM